MAENTSRTALNRKKTKRGKTPEATTRPAGNQEQNTDQTAKEKKQDPSYHERDTIGKLIDKMMDASEIIEKTQSLMREDTAALRKTTIQEQTARTKTEAAEEEREDPIARKEQGRESSRNHKPDSLEQKLAK